MADTQTVDEVIADTYLFATGKGVPPTSGSTKYIKILALLNLFTKEWAREPDTEWNSLRQLFAVAAAVSATDTYALPITIERVSQQESDFVRIYHTDGVKESDYTIVPIQRLYDGGPIVSSAGVSRRNAVGTCALVGSNIVFSRAFTSTDPQFGGSIKVPGSAIPPVLVNGTDVVAVDDPAWLSSRSAAEYVRTDVTRVQLYPSLLDIANDKMNGMKTANESQVEEALETSFSLLGESWS